MKTGIALMVAGIACVCAVVVAPALALTEFRAKSVPTEVKDQNKGTHVFSIPGSIAPVECTEVNSHGKVTKSKAAAQTDIVEYTKCTAFGAAAKLTNAEYEFKIDNTVAQLNTVTIEGGGCVLLVKPEHNTKLSTVTYSNVSSKNKEVEVKANVSGITVERTSGSESVCGSSGKETTYKGTSIVHDSGVDLEVV